MRGRWPGGTVHCFPGLVVISLINRFGYVFLSGRRGDPGVHPFGNFQAQNIPVEVHFLIRTLCSLCGPYSWPSFHEWPSQTAPSVWVVLGSFVSSISGLGGCVIVNGAVTGL